MSELRVDLKKLSEAYNEALPNLNSEEQQISIQIYQLLAEGMPVSHKAIAESINYPIDKVSAIIENWIGVYHNDENNIIGYWGIALQEMPHRFEVEGKVLFTWCAWDSLFIPELMQKTGHVESTDPITKEKIRITVTPDGIHDLEPAGAVMSYVKPEDTVIDENVINGFCHYIHFFTSEKSGKEWVSQHENTALISMDDAFKLAKSKNECQYSEILSTLQKKSIRV